MASIKQEVATALKTCLSTATEGDDLTTLAAAARAISNTTGDLAQRTNLDLFLDFELTVVIQAPVHGDVIATLWVIPKVNNSTYPTAAGTTDDPDDMYLAGSFVAYSAATSQVMQIIGVKAPPHDCRFVLKNEDTTAFTSGTHTLKCQPSRLVN